jgi:hypothetical protein
MLEALGYPAYYGAGVECRRAEEGTDATLTEGYSIYH